MFMKKSELKKLVKHIFRECMNPECGRVCERCKTRFEGSMVCPKCGQNQISFQKNDSSGLKDIELQIYNKLKKLKSFKIGDYIGIGKKFSANDKT